MSKKIIGERLKNNPYAESFSDRSLGMLLGRGELRIELFDKLNTFIRTAALYCEDGKIDLKALQDYVDFLKEHYEKEERLLMGLSQGEKETTTEKER